VLDITTRGAEAQRSREQHAARAALAQGACGGSGLGPLLTVVVAAEARPMTFPERADFPPLPPFLADLPPVTEPARQRAIHYEMVDRGTSAETQLFINQSKLDGACANETLTVDVPERWTLWNNSLTIAHPFHIHQNPFQLLSQSDRGTYKYPVWRDVVAIPTATPPGTPKPPAAWPPNSNPQDANRPWGSAVIVYVARELTGGFVHHSHILGHADRGMMHSTQVTCANGRWAETGPVPPGARCDAAGFCPGDCQLGAPLVAIPACPAPPPQQSNWPSKYGVK
jgi:FtsP/CotA-like multicopper oxidase with cupredoxin domain